MGRKRGRSIRGAVGDAASNKVISHAQTLGDDVRELRDVEFASEKKQNEKLKRRKMMDEQEFAAIKKEEAALRKAAKRQSVDSTKSRKAGLEMWKKAATKRRDRARMQRESGVDNADDDSVAVLETDSVDEKISAKILEEARLQRAEIRHEAVKRNADEAAHLSATITDELRDVGKKSSAMGAANTAESDEDEDEDVQSIAHTDAGTAIGEEERDLDFLDASGITEDEETALSMFTTINPRKENDREGGSGTVSDSAPRVMLADIILDKIREKEEADARAAAIAADPERAERDRKIAEVYGLVGNIMTRYRSGKVPKAFKVIPKQSNWEALMYLTRPDEWSSAALFVATRLLASNLPAKEVVRFYQDVLLPRCLEDISENKKLNYHLYKALGKAVYKPDAFVKGILFPLFEEGGCTLRQATIFGSVLRKVSLPALHSAAALLFICQKPYSPSTSIILTSILDKKYALPYRVIDAVVESFLEMKSDPRPLPVAWHQSLLSFAQTYKMELTMEQKEKLKVLMRCQVHHAVTEEIRRELFSARNRGDLMDPDANTIARNIAEAAAMV